MSMWATTWPAVTKSPSSTSSSMMRPASFVATSISVASMRPLLLAKPAGSFAGWKNFHPR